MSKKKFKSQKVKVPITKKTPDQRDIVGWILAILAMILYVNTLSHGYAFDDGIVITENSFTQKGFSGIADLMTTDFFQGIYGNENSELTGGRYRPLSLVMFAIEYQFFGMNPFIGHFINVLLYGLTVYLMYVVLHQWFSTKNKKSFIPLISTALFAIHPLHTEVVANIKSRDEILALLLILMTYYSIEKIDKATQKTKWLIIGIGSFFLSMLAKESAFTFILLIPITLYVLKSKTIKEVAKTSIPFWIAGVAYLALRTAMVGGMGGDPNPDIMENPFIGASIVNKFATISVILLKYLSLLFFPHPLSADYSFNQIPWTDFKNIKAILGLLIYIAMAVYVLMKIRKRDIIALCILLFFVPLSLTTNILFNIGAPMAERFLYIPTLGFCLAVGYVLNKWFKLSDWSTFRKNIPLTVGLVILLLAGSSKTIMRNLDWKNNVSLFGADVKTVPNSAKVHYYYANANLQEYLSSDKTSPESLAKLDLAEKHFKQSVSINPKFHTAMYNIGLVYELRQNGVKAEEYLQKTLALVPNHTKTHDLLAKVYARFLNQPDKALHHLNILINQAGFKTAKNYQLQGVAFGMKQDFNNAIAAFEKALQLEPNNSQVIFNYGITLDQMGQRAKAQQYLERAYALDPSLRR